MLAYEEAMMEPHKNLTESIYEILRTDILKSTIKPGEKLSEVRLAKRFNVSRAPIRDAITKLQQDQLVLVKPQVGTIIMPVSLKKAKDILQIRLLLEPYAAQIAAQKITKEDRELLRDQFEKLARVKDAGEGKKQRLFETDWLLHNLIWERCENPEIKAIINNYRDEMQRVRRSTVELKNRMLPSEKEMREIYKALLANKGPQARKAMVTHLANILRAVQSISREKDEDQDRK
jgi:DNA-binding GntR family transcriptional regulator